MRRASQALARGAGFRHGCIADFQTGGAFAMTGALELSAPRRFGNLRHSRLGSLRYDFVNGRELLMTVGDRWGLPSRRSSDITHSMLPQDALPGLSGERSKWFVTTHWSVVLNAGNSVSPEAESALNELCKSYWYPLYAYVRRKGHDPDESKDLTQEFFAQLLAKRLLAGVDPSKGRFRSWLLAVMNHFLAHEWAKARREKRGGGRPVLSLDEPDPENRYRLEPADECDPEKVFDRRWALTLMDRAGGRLRTEYENAGKSDVYSSLKGFVSMDGTDLNYDEAAQRLGLTTSAIKSAIHRLRQRYQELIREEIAQTVSTAAEVDDEIKYLLTVLRG